MRFFEFKKLNESRGVTARTPGETYVNDSNPADILTFNGVQILTPQGQQAFETSEEMLAALELAIPPGSIKIEDNKPNASTRAAIIASVTDTSGDEQLWVRYIREVPPQGVNTMWQTLRGYKYGKAAKEESIPIKPSDIITDEDPRDVVTLANDVKTGIAAQVQGTPYTPLASIMTTAVDLAMQGAVTPIKGGAEYSRVVAKYGGEYLGPIAVIGGGVVKGDIANMLSKFKIKSLQGSTVYFPQNTTEELIDSVFTLPNGMELQVSTKIHTGGGAASSLSGVAKQLTPAIERKFPIGAQIIKDLGEMSAVAGPLKVAKDLGIITDADITAFNAISKSSQNINSIQSPTLVTMTQAQGVEEGTLGRVDYRVFYHCLTAVVNKVIVAVNDLKEFPDAMMAALNNNNYLQLITDARSSGDNLTLDYYGKFPAVFAGRPYLRNKSYFATGQKGRLGFKLGH